jgi:hypothetical protein
MPYFNDDDEFDVWAVVVEPDKKKQPVEKTSDPTMSRS